MSRLIGVVLFFVSLNSGAEFLFDNGEWEHEAGAEWRQFREIGKAGQAKRGLSLRYQPRFFKSWGPAAFVFKPYIRWDQNDDERTHMDIREMYWEYYANTWDVKAGINKVYWGRLEFSNIVDVINQDDFVDNDDEKLGQPMVKFSWLLDRGFFDFYILPGFRERTYPGKDGRLRFPLVVDEDAARFDNGEVYGLDFAFRWLVPLDNGWEVALSHFSGMSREPDFSFNFDFEEPRLIPVYKQIDQTGLEAEWLYEGWAFKFEAINVSGRGDRFSVVAAGLEYTWGDIMGSGHDITWVLENIHDSREEDAPTFLERDVALGFRWSANDVAGTEGLGGMLYDPETEERLITLEGSRRLGESWKIFLRARAILEQGEPEVGDNVLEAINSLNESELADDIGDEDFKIFLADLILEAELLDLLRSQPLQALQELQRVADTDRKLNILENDDYVELELVRYF